MIGYVILGVVVVLLLVMVVRALMLKPQPITEIADMPMELNEDKIVQDMVDMIRCKTISYRDESLEDKGEYEKYYALLQVCFPNIYEKCQFEMVGRNGLLYFLEGENHDAPSVCMAHYDVVPIEEDGWEKPAFEGIIEDGFIWGRGTLDTKGTMCGVMEALEYLLGQGYKPKQDLYLSFSGEEEINGDTCAQIVSHLEAKGVKPAFVLDEGGAVVENVFPGVKGECAVIGVCEKGSANFELSLPTSGGHSSTPPKHTNVGELAAAVCAIENHPFPAKKSQAVAEMFEEMGRHASFGMKLVLANIWLFRPILAKVSPLIGGEVNALMRTTCAITMMEGSKAFNVLAPKAKVGMNLRLMQGDTMESAVAYLQKVIKNDKIKIEVVEGSNPSITSDTNCPQWDKLKQVIHATWPEAIVSPYTMLACSDSRHYCRITDRVYRFSAMKLSSAERKMIHGHNERIPVETLIKTVEFYVRMLREI